MAEKDNTESDEIMYCAACGVKEDNDMKLKKCTACYLVRYCSVKCQRDHRPQHKKECKKRAAELQDEILFQQPNGSHHGDCPICFLPMPLENHRSVKLACCFKEVCIGCTYANELRELEGRLEHKCTFCRHPTPRTTEECDRALMKRVNANDPAAIRHLGNRLYNKGDYGSAYQHWTKAALLGDIEAHNLLSNLYREGKVVEKDLKKEVYHSEKAAIGGHAPARHNLGCHEFQNGSTERAVKHFIICANLGYGQSVNALKELYARGAAGKEVYAAALRAYQAAVDATKSVQREVGETAQTRTDLYSTFHHRR